MEAENIYKDIWHNKVQKFWRIRTSDELHVMYGKSKVLTKLTLTY